MNNYIYNNKAEQSKRGMRIPIKFERATTILALIGLGMILISILSKSNSMDMGGEAVAVDPVPTPNPTPAAPTTNELGIPQ